MKMPFPTLLLSLLGLQLCLLPVGCDSTFSAVRKAVNESELLTIPDDYNARISPKPDEGGPTNIEFVFIVDDILEVNDRSFSMTIEVKMTMEWREPRIKLNAGVFDQHFSEEELVLDAKVASAIWTPNFSIGHLIKFDRLETLNPADFLRIMPESTSNFSMYHQGTYVVKLKCPMEFNTFPFDKHVCYFEVYMDRPDSAIHVQYVAEDPDSWGWAATTTTLDYQTQFSPLPQSHLVKQLRFANGSVIPVSVTGFQIQLERKVNYYIFNYFVPSGLFVIVSWVSFVIPPESVPGRVALIITTLLVLINIANTVFAISPAADAINALQTWILACICFVVSTVIEYSLVLFITRNHRRNKLQEAIDAAMVVTPEDGIHAVGPKLFFRKRSSGGPVVKVNAAENGGVTSRSDGTLRSLKATVSSDSGGAGTPMSAAAAAEETRLQVLILNMDYSFVIILSTSFLIFNICYWVVLY